MWWPLRNQILVPLLAILTVAIAAMAAITATVAVRRGERQTVEQLRRVIDTLGRSSFPFTPAVLEKMRGLSGAHFVAFDEHGRVAAATLAGADRLAASTTGQNALGTLHDDPRVSLGGTVYLPARLRARPGSPGTLLILYPEESWRQTRWEAALPPLAVGGGAIALVVLAAGWIAHKLGGRLRSVQLRVAAIAAGDFRELDPGRRRDEVQELVLSVNRMSPELRRMREEVRRKERAGVLAQLAAGLAHQLRNAVTGARLAVQLHARRCPTARGDRSLDVALRQLTLTEEQLKGLLALGRCERPPSGPCDVGRLLDEVALLVGPACEHARVALRTTPREGAMTVTADADGLRAAVLNLTLNAVEAAGPGGHVELDASASNGSVYVDVADDGPGPPPELAETLFDPFVTSKPSGVGLGLALAKSVSLNHGGELSWDRDVDRNMTRFRLRLPRNGSAGGTPGGVPG